MAQLVKNPLAMRETWVRSLGWEDGLYSPWGREELDMTERLSLYPAESLHGKHNYQLHPSIHLTHLPHPTKENLAPHLSSPIVSLW